jgi:hypothetical protein
MTRNEFYEQLNFIKIMIDKNLNITTSLTLKIIKEILDLQSKIEKAWVVNIINDEEFFDIDDFLKKMLDDTIIDYFRFKSKRL